MRREIKNQQYTVNRNSVRRMLLAIATILLAFTSIQSQRAGAAEGEPTEPPPANQSGVTDANTVLFLHFDNSLTGVDGENFTQATGVTFSPGILAQGVLIDSTDVLNYATSGNFTAAQGTIEFWIKPQWNGNDNVTHCPFSIGNDLNIYKDGANNLRFIIRLDDSEAYQAYNVGGWLANQWHHIAATWSVPGQMKTYVDGTERISHASSNQDLISPVPPNLSIGSRNNACQANAIIDELHQRCRPFCDRSRTKLFIGSHGFQFDVSTSVSTTVPRMDVDAKTHCEH